MRLPAYSPLKKYWLLDDHVTFLNHGSFGACPVPVLKRQDAYRAMMEAEPVRFMARELEELLWESKQVLGAFMGAAAADLVFIPNATYGVNMILQSLHFEKGDELLTTDHAYGACANALQWFAEKAGAQVVMAAVPMPISSPDEVVEAIMNKVTPHTRLAMVDHITSVSGLIFPIEKIVRALNARGVDCLVDGAHAPGHLPLDLEKIGAAYYTGTCHKWVCSPKGSSFLHVRKDKQPYIKPLTVSHRFDRPVAKEREWSSDFFWPGTNDFSAYLAVKDALDFMQHLFKGGWNALWEHNRTTCLAARKLIAAKTGAALPAPDEMTGCLAVFYLGKTQLPPFGFNYIHPLQEQLWRDYHIDVPVFVWNRNDPRLWLRISVQCYNSMEQYEYLAAALKDLLPDAHG